MAYKYFSILYLFILSVVFTLAKIDTHAAASLSLEMDSASRKQQTPMQKSRISDHKAYKVSDLHFGFKPFSPLMGAQKMEGTENEKLLSNVKVFPNQISDQLSLSFKLNKDSNVSIKVMDALGNEVTTLLSQRLSAGEQSNTFNLGSKLNQGFYFIRVVAGTETIVKRIEVL
ncbi:MULTISPECIES: T9SS type A sorting domain-containing protein [Olivibacter]|uniref:T9SS type A sorting domain-containing protein n=2 Tax=Olivibacter TaxID=376469 RepID=A0ABV6HLY1_9SPHI|nr:MULTISPECIES: T9SS type A sorting domain-containing protein [Olivibacter]MDX3914254.1 T9SS type A sorting domain-containing protein [Pseudosphingobacterium sp.]QEL02386.1 T9SS type A sorting domain-containing protein [Olivibacter sp. LS-1]